MSEPKGWKAGYLDLPARQMFSILDLRLWRHARSTRESTLHLADFYLKSEPTEGRTRNE